METGSKVAASSAIKIAMTFSRQEEADLKKELLEDYGVRAVAVDYGGEFISQLVKS